MGDTQRTELAAFLRARRAQVTQRGAGLPEDMVPGRRLTPSLRREEVAELAGMSLTWYTWLEQGRRTAASPQAIDALAGRCWSPRSTVTCVGNFDRPGGQRLTAVIIRNTHIQPAS